MLRDSQSFADTDAQTRGGVARMTSVGDFQGVESPLRQARERERESCKVVERAIFWSTKMVLESRGVVQRSCQLCRLFCGLPRQRCRVALQCVGLSVVVGFHGVTARIAEHREVQGAFHNSGLAGTIN